ncbi:MAG: A24 family peptidase C-terminal domain-containing protein [Candidatus Wildermuthbacteria bacterium]|nr:A24 family peptidase C-terminal domain-containing protein [Candidatus Wildermuthbacteria bacterium]
MPIFIFSILLFLGGWIAYYDIKKGVIKNYSISVLVLAAIFINIFLTKTFIEYPLASLLNIFFAILASATIWIAGLWSAADAKLYIGLVALFSVSWLRSAPDYFPGFAILINSALLLFLLLFFQTLIKTSLKDKIQSMKKILKPASLFRLLIPTMGMILLSNLISDFLKIRLSYFLIVPLWLGIFWIVESKFKTKLTHFFIFIIIFSFVFFPHLIGLNFFITVLALSSTILLVSFIMSLATPLFTEEVKISELKGGAILTEMILEKGQRFIKQPMGFSTFFASLRERIKSKPLFGYNPDGLTLNEIEEIQQLAEKGELNFETIRIAKTMPLAPALILGILVTYFLKGSFIGII